MNYVILAGDPGGTCGYATTWTGDVLGQLRAGQAAPEVFLDWAAAYLGSAFVPDCQLLVVMERFTVTVRTARMSPQYDALETIGVMRFLARRAGARFKLQDPSPVKTFAPDAKLRNWGVHQPGQVHANDATRHALYAATDEGYRDWLQL